MLLNVPPLNRNQADFPLSFKTLGHVIEAVGTPDFVPRLTLLLNEVVPLNVVHIERSRVDRSKPTVTAPMAASAVGLAASRRRALVRRSRRFMGYKRITSARLAKPVRASGSAR